MELYKKMMYFYSHSEFYIADKENPSTDQEAVTHCIFTLILNSTLPGLNQCNSRAVEPAEHHLQGETIFCILICIMGLVFFSHLIGNMQVFIHLFILLKLYA
jgi:hypothetical protein